MSAFQSELEVEIEAEAEPRYSDVVPAPSSRFAPAYRLTALRPASQPPPRDGELEAVILEVLLAAAHADGEMCGREQRTVRRIMERLTDSSFLPPALAERIEAFDPTEFDAREAAELLLEITPQQRRHVLELVREVCDANNAFDLSEERFLLDLTRALELTPEDIADLVVHAPEGIHGSAKRLFDLAFSAAFLGSAWPLLLLLAAGVKLSSPGPALFRQDRSGRDGRTIGVLKFRTMRATENGADVRQATKGDPRVTRFGAFLRRTSLDELPQFVNVLLGDMSVVGPRPHAVAHNQHYRTKILEYMLRHKVRPGITGWAQVNGFRGETDTVDKMVERVACDLEYIRRWSLGFDLRIVWLTVFGKGTRQNAY
ncbi:MAG TPA: exopolysaccharide biosynthesis polyprenyl glycosylphosphotransferase [Polyangiaceae bacterium]|nr:exopolysaccharide biosynthesis polyprenyl glycosylphosphotransferase [Polyangiaceae bacterium]